MTPSIREEASVKPVHYSFSVQPDGIISKQTHETVHTPLVMSLMLCSMCLLMVHALPQEEEW